MSTAGVSQNVWWLIIFGNLLAVGASCSSSSTSKQQNTFVMEQFVSRLSIRFFPYVTSQTLYGMSARTLHFSQQKRLRRRRINICHFLDPVLT